MDVILDCICSFSPCCSCYRSRITANGWDLYEPLLQEEERIAVNDLLSYLNKDNGEKTTINDDRLRALLILTYSDNVELQRSAALCYAEISERLMQPVTLNMMEPLVVLLQCRDLETTRATTLAVSNLAINGPDTNKEVIIQSGCVGLLTNLMSSPDVEVQCNTCGCITTLATTDANKKSIVAAGGIGPLLVLARSTDIRVQRNATGALLNLTHIQSNRSEMVSKGAIPLFVNYLRSKDSEVVYYCTAALSNIAVDSDYRTLMIGIGHYDIIRSLIQLLSYQTEKVKCQACLALRNLASDDDNQVTIAHLGALPHLYEIVVSGVKDTQCAALAALRNLSIHRKNEVTIVTEGFLPELCNILQDPDSLAESKCHAAGTVRNLAAGDQIKPILHNGTVDSLLVNLLEPSTPTSVQIEITAALAVLAGDDEAKMKLTTEKNGNTFARLVNLAACSPDREVQYNCAGTIGQLVQIDFDEQLIASNLSGLMKYLERFLQSADVSFNHIALWTLIQLLKDPYLKSVFNESSLLKLVENLSFSVQPQIKKLAETVLATLN
ncbi:uncharacterized protein [Ptychodera flava]|uniref:uncharacterized protein n=1 Tax=Ptychodera flava TaxID=63121 RepID=UPI003969ED3D